MPVSEQLSLKFQVVFDDPVVHHRHPVVAVRLRMGIGVGRPPVGRPTGVAQPGGAQERVRAGWRTKAPHFADRLAKL